MIRTLILDWATNLKRIRWTPSPRWGEGWGEGGPRSIGCTPLTLALSPAGRGDIPSQPQPHWVTPTLRALAFVFATAQAVHAQTPPAPPQSAPQAPQQRLTIGVVEIENDPRYE